MPLSHSGLRMLQKPMGKALRDTVLHHVLDAMPEPEPEILQPPGRNHRRARGVVEVSAQPAPRESPLPTVRDDAHSSRSENAPD